MAQPVIDVLDRATDDQSAIAVSNQNDIAEPLEQNGGNHVPNVGCEVDFSRQQVRSLTHASESWRKNLVTGSFQDWPNFPPAPTAMPCAVNKHKCSHEP